MNKTIQSPKLGVVVASYYEDEDYFYVEDELGVHKYAKSQYAPIYDVVNRRQEAAGCDQSLRKGEEYDACKND